MPKVQVLNMQGSPVGELELNEYVFGIEPNTHVMHSAVLAQLSWSKTWNSLHIGSW